MESALKERPMLLEILAHLALLDVNLLLVGFLFLKNRLVRVGIDGAQCGDLSFIVVRQL